MIFNITDFVVWVSNVLSTAEFIKISMISFFKDFKSSFIPYNFVFLHYSPSPSLTLNISLKYN